jgi:hypothetical protein
MRDQRQVRYAFVVCALLGRGKDHRIRLAQQPAYVLFMVGDGRGVDQGNSRGRRAQDHHHVSLVQPTSHRTKNYPCLAGSLEQPLKTPPATRTATSQKRPLAEEWPFSFKLFRIFGAGRGGRTPMTLRSADFESAASANSTIPAQCFSAQARSACIEFPSSELRCKHRGLSRIATFVLYCLSSIV